MHKLIGHSPLSEINPKGTFELMIVTEFMEKGSLSKLLEKEPELSYIKRLKIANGIADGMVRMHDLVSVQNYLVCLNCIPITEFSRENATKFSREKSIKIIRFRNFRFNLNVFGQLSSLLVSI